MQNRVHGRLHFGCCAFEKPLLVVVVVAAAVAAVVAVVAVLIVVGRAPSLKFKNWPLLFDSSLFFAFFGFFSRKLTLLCVTRHCYNLRPIVCLLVLLLLLLLGTKSQSNAQKGEKSYKVAWLLLLLLLLLLGCCFGVLFRRSILILR